MAAPLNEIGDALAGFAGALAFVWIIVTVAMQSQQLKAQRAELTLTRLEFEAQRKATEDMARSMQLQTQIFTQETRDIDDGQIIRFIEDRLNRIKAAAPLERLRCDYWRHKTGRSEGVLPIVSEGMVASYRLLPARDYFEQLSALIESSYVIADWLLRNGKAAPIAQERDVLSNLLELIHEIPVEIERLSPLTAKSLAPLRIREVDVTLCSILNDENHCISATRQIAALLTRDMSPQVSLYGTENP